MRTKTALHRVQNLGKECEAIRKREELRTAVQTYLEWRTMQSDAVEDDETCLASSIGRHMAALRERFEEWQWERELEVQDARLAA